MIWYGKVPATENLLLQLIKKEGVNSLSLEELRAACEARGMRVIKVNHVPG